jgi:uncharacterized protein (TIGR02145 family)
MKQLFIISIMAISLPLTLYGQVTIGSDQEPKVGAILDLNSGVKGGLLLSNVTLTNLHDIPSGLAGISDIAREERVVKEAFCGAMVYHFGGDGSIPAGVYIWNGAHWSKDGAPLSAPVITSMTFDKTIIASAPPILSIVAAGEDDELTYQWEEYNPYITSVLPSWDLIPGATSASCTIPAPESGAGIAKYYRCKVNNDSLTTISHVFRVYVCKSGHSITDTEGHCYCTDHFGSAGEWMTMNLRSTGTIQGNDWEPLTEDKDPSATEALYYYFPNATVDTIAHPEYGLLYTWTAANIPDTDNSTSVRQGICPDGWHLPNTTEWENLKNEVNEDAGYFTFDYAHGGDGRTGMRMQSPIDVNPNDGFAGGNSFASTHNGFEAFLVGHIFEEVSGYGTTTGFWTSNKETGGNISYDLYMNNNHVSAERDSDGYMFSVRCKQDTPTP